MTASAPRYHKILTDSSLQQRRQRRKQQKKRLKDLQNRALAGEGLEGPARFYAAAFGNC
jgi:hypothetical protein